MTGWKRLREHLRLRAMKRGRVEMRKLRCHCCDELIWCVVGPRWAKAAVIRETPCLGSERLNLPQPAPATSDSTNPTAPIPPHRPIPDPPDRGVLLVEAGGAHRVQPSRFHRGGDGIGGGVAHRLIGVG